MSPQSSAGEGSEPLEKGPAYDEVLGLASGASKTAWPTYRRDARRSGYQDLPAPSKPEVAWTRTLASPITAPVAAGGMVVVAETDCHTLHALSAVDGEPAWTFVADGRIDSPPTLSGGLCLFGTRSGFVYCLRTSDGALVWRFRAAPQDRRLFAYEQLESVWPVHGSVLVDDKLTDGVATAYFAAGRQSLSDGGIFVFAVNPTSGKIRWVRRLDSVPQTQSYGSSALDFDNFDLLFRQGDGVAMSRWVFNRKTGKMSVDSWASFAKLNTTISSSTYDPATGQLLMDRGTVLPLEKGPLSDEFFLTFDRLGGNSFSRPIPVTPPAATPQNLPPASEIGVRTFDEINASLAAITGVNPADSGISDTFNTVRQSLPTVDSIEAFLSSHQMAIAQLAIQYCGELMDDPTLRNTVFPGFPFTSGVAIAYPGSQDFLLDPLLDRVLGTSANSIGSQPDRATAKTELEQLIHGIPGDANRPGLASTGGNAVRTQTIAKATCAALLGSAAMLVQ